MKPLSRDELDMLTQRIHRDRKAGAGCRNWVEPVWMQQAERLIAEVEGYRAAPLMIVSGGIGGEESALSILPGPVTFCERAKEATDA